MCAPYANEAIAILGLERPDLTTDTNPNEIAADAPVTVTFKELGLDPKIIKALDDMGYERPTPIQAAAIPFALSGKDVLGIAQTGTGKTGAFTLPTVHKLAKGRARARMPRLLAAYRLPNKIKNSRAVLTYLLQRQAVYLINLNAGKFY